VSQLYVRTPALYVRAKPRRFIPLLIAIATLLGVGTIGVIAGATLFSPGTSSAAGNGSAAQDALADVMLTKCAIDADTGWPRATLQVTNHGTGRASYVVTIAFQSHDGTTRYGYAPTGVQDLAAGRKATTVAVGLKAAPRMFSCAVASVDREPETGLSSAP
jgi:hypothetical protein